MHMHVYMQDARPYYMLIPPTQAMTHRVEVILDGPYLR